MPQLERFREQEGSLGFRLFLIDATGMLRRTRAVMREKGAGIPVLLDSHSYSRQVLGTIYTPTTFVIDAEGRLRCRLVGHSPEYTQILQDVLSRI